MQARIVDAPYGRVPDEQMRDVPGILGVDLQARVQSADAAQREETVERSAGHADAVRPPGHALVQIGCRGDDGAADDVAVAVEILRGRMQDEVRTERDRSLP